MRCDVKINSILKILTLIVAIVVVAAAGYDYTLYNRACNNNQQYSGVELIQSSDEFAVCGENFGIVNTGDAPIVVVEYATDGSTMDAEKIETDATVNNSVTVESGSTLAIKASNNIVYEVLNPLGSNLEHKVEVRKF